MVTPVMKDYMIIPTPVNRRLTWGYNNHCNTNVNVMSIASINALMQCLLYDSDAMIK